MAKILIVDDEPGVRSILREILERQGHEVSGAANVGQARDALARHDFELVLCDINMPDESGLELLAHIRPMMPSVAVVMISVIADPEVAAQTLDLGASGYIPKPFDRNEIIINVASVLKRREAELENLTHREDLESLVARRSAELMESEKRYRTLVQTITEGLVSLDPSARLVFFNNRFAEMLGYPPVEVAGKLICEFLSPEDKEVFRRKLARPPESDHESYELAWRTKGGDQVLTRVYPKALFDQAGELIGYQALITDITEQRILEAQMLQAQKLEAIGQLAAGIAHEINTPTQYVADNTRFFQKSLEGLAAVIRSYGRLRQQVERAGGHQEILAELDEVLSETGLDYLMGELPLALKETMEGLEHISRIVKSVKEFAHPGHENLTPLDINAAVQNTITVARNEWKYVAEMEAELDPDLPLVPCYPGQLNQVILNLVVNAAQALAEKVGDSGKKGVIKVTTRKARGMAEIQVGDNGPGIPDEIRERVFDPFFTTKAPGKGTGQGLAIAHRVIVEKHKGEISLTSRQGEGATFSIRLPLSLEAV